MAKKSNNTAVGIAIQAAPDAFSNPARPADLMPVSNVRLGIEGQTITNDEYTGSVVNNGDVIAGKRVTLSYNVKLRPPGGEAVPAANAYLPGRVMQAAKLTELRTTTAIPPAPEALGAGSTTKTVTLGTAAANTIDLYKGMPLLLTDNGATYPQRLTAIRGNDADRNATLVEELPSAPASTYQIPPHLAYFRSNSSDDPIMLSHSVWLGGDRYDLMNCRLTSLRAVVPTSTRDQAAYPEFEASFDATIADYETEAAPAVPPGGAIPLFKDGDMHLSYKRVAGSTFTIDLGISSENPPNPNKVDGSDAPEITGSNARVSMTRHKYAKDEFDTLAKADAQEQHPFWAQWGRAPGNVVSIVVPDARFDYQNPDLGGGFVTESGDLVIDAFDRSVAIVFPFQ